MSTVLKSRPPATKKMAMERIASRDEPVVCLTRAKVQGPQIELNFENTE
jgi:hypothetical protein